MQLRIEIDEAGIDSLRTLAEERLPEARRQMVESAVRLTLFNTIRGNPVDTARSRASWVQSLERLGGIPPAGWRGPRPIQFAIDEGRARALLQQKEDEHQTTVSATSRVFYVSFLEYGTGGRPPYAMLQRALISTRLLLPRLFRLD
ncbi:hypothetical protein Mal4_54000 [Maioricimonas rarisocia]|uniref:Uncharacterized protein n=1 Tax=Maioricimonas rarisocia TaxID=2528026 RepID=A0A517ZEX1_9PLAN|nr:hypothetical protein [Maioricimonas rarisocia]QDU41035.1 hypothetical protein Mal4_54000 [Maioricimonas rarisocia]